MKFGLLGGGQLARLLAVAAAELGLEVHVLSESADDPAASVAHRWHEGSLHERAVLEKFLSDVNVATFESEFLNADILSELQEQTATPIFPRPVTMGLLQDRLSQKQSLVSLDLPTAAFIDADLGDANTLARLEECLARWGGLVLKKRRGGYDGNGTFIARSRAELAVVLAEISTLGETAFIAEELVVFSREVAVMVARSRDGSRVVLPFVETHQENSRCLWVQGPLILPEAAAMVAKLEHFAEALDYVGIMGVEFFETPRGLIVNELAPRVHNSAHYSIEGLNRSQFTLHVQAVLGEPLVTPTLSAGGFAMWNLLGSDARAPRWQLWPSDVSFHWYQKIKNRAGRKMGHLTALAETPRAAFEKLKHARALFDL